MSDIQRADNQEIEHGQKLLTALADINQDTIYRNSNKNNKNDLFQKLASKKVFVILQGLISCCFMASLSYYNATITTLEKRYQIPSRNAGLISIGFDLSSIIMTPVFSFYLGIKYRPQWVGFSGFIAGVYCLMVALLYTITGPGQYALSFTENEYRLENYTAIRDDMPSSLCSADRYHSDDCSAVESTNGNLFPQLYLFLAQFLAGFFANVHDSVGISYMDDNILKSKIPMYLGIMQCLRLCGPALGYLLASISLKLYIAPWRTPNIGANDSKWLGAWWLGYVVIGVGLIVFSFLMALFPTELPHAAFRRKISEIKSNSMSNESVAFLSKSSNDQNLNKILKVLKSLLLNKIFMFTLLSNGFYYFGTVTFTMYGAKYVETQFRQTASYASLLTGSTTTACVLIGIFTSGWLIHKFQPQSQTVATWTMCTGCASLVLISSFIFISCTENETATRMTNQTLHKLGETYSQCNCDLVKYMPVCGDDQVTYLSPCHAGCTQENVLQDRSLIYANCSFVNKDMKIAKSGPCNVDCSQAVLIFIVILCVERLLSSSGRTSCFFLTVKSIRKEIKPFGLAIGLTLTSLLVFIPAPIIFGWIFDATCLFWGKTCNGDGNCWLYDNQKTRLWLIITSIASIMISIAIDYCVVKNVHGLLLFDKNEDKLANELKIIERTMNDDTNNEIDAK